MKKKKVVIGLSGGVDSSVAALLLQKKGYEVIGVFLKLYSDTKNPITGECKYIEDLKMAKKIALRLNISLHVLDYEKEYTKKVLQPMFKDYNRGLTPNPDLLCNKLMKFPLLIKAAKKFRADYIATGHYARLKKASTGWQLLCGRDKSKDQSYFLADLSQKDLSKTIFPIGNYTKKEVRKIARKNEFPNWNKHGTVGICFVGQDNMIDFLKTKLRENKGEVIMPDGTKIGSHKGAYFYTEGQKAGESSGIDIIKPQELAQMRFYVVKKNLKKNLLVVAPEGDNTLYKKEIKIGKIHFINEPFPKKGVSVRIRHLGEYYKGKLAIRNGKKHFVFDKPVKSVAPGQKAVFSVGQKIFGCAKII